MCFYYCLPHLLLSYFFTVLVVDILRAFENVRSVATSLSLGNLKAFHLEVLFGIGSRNSTSLY